MNRAGFSLGLGAVIWLAGCASERVVLLPSFDGGPSAVVLRDASGELLLNQPYAAVERWGSWQNIYRSSAEDVEARFAAALAAMPTRPNSYMLYFEPGSDVLTAASQAEFAKMRQEVSRRAASEITVIGHTDRVGNEPSNDALSKARADVIRDQLIASGVAAESLEAVGRGERDLLVATEDEVDEPRNRRVEINVR